MVNVAPYFMYFKIYRKGFCWLWTKVAKQWKMDAEKFYCDGCKSEKELFNCDAKKCAIARGLPTCSHCDDFPSCDKEIWTKWPELKKKTEKMRRNLPIL